MRIEGLLYTVVLRVVNIDSIGLEPWKYRANQRIDKANLQDIDSVHPFSVLGLVLPPRLIRNECLAGESRWVSRHRILLEGGEGTWLVFPCFGRVTWGPRA